MKLLIYLRILISYLDIREIKNERNAEKIIGLNDEH
jgi:transposase-like protein